MSLYGMSFKIMGLIRLLIFTIESCPRILRKRLVTFRCCTVPSVLILSSFFSARHFTTKDKVHAVADYAFCRSKICLSVVGLDNIVVVENMGQNLQMKIYKN